MPGITKCVRCHEEKVDELEIRYVFCPPCMVKEFNQMQENNREMIEQWESKIKREKSVWYILKGWALFSLLVLPFSLFLYVKFNLLTELIFIGGLTLSPLLNFATDWLNERT